VAAAAVGWAGCGGASAAAPAAMHADFREIQAGEARLERALAVAHDATRPCAARCEAAGAATEASEAVCAVAASTTDLDADRRCEAARARTREGAARSREACPCAPEPARPRAR
jgi:hypothetical protein